MRASHDRKTAATADSLVQRRSTSLRLRDVAHTSYRQLLTLFLLYATTSTTIQEVTALANPSSRQNRQKLRPLSQRPKELLQIEQDLWKTYSYIIGSDDSGGGCIAGPIVTASVCLLQPVTLPGVADSKVVNSEVRQQVYQQVCDNPQTYAWTYAIRDNQQIDEMGVHTACMSAFTESIQTLATHEALKEKSLYSIVDGKRSPAQLVIPSRPWTQGDQCVYTVALASILARVVRDQLVQQAADIFPEYAFAQHGGYPTSHHLNILNQLGPCAWHRTTTKPVQARLGLSRQQFLNGALFASLSLSLPQSSEATYMDKKTGISLPEKGEIAAAIPQDWINVDNPFSSSSDFQRLDSNPDEQFYQDPRFVEHIDEAAVQKLTNYVSSVAQGNVLDLCSSWTSHLDPTIAKAVRVVGLGMNAQELKANPSLTDYTVQDLNQKPTLPYTDATFDTVLCQLSIDYLTQPLQVCREIGRVLKSGGTVHILFSNRLFLQKAVAIWTGADDVDHAYTVACYLHFAQGGFQSIQATDLSARDRNDKIIGDPLYAVTATKG
ncbi:hypothetical protein FisN_13Hh040 [Fistulifera solaris]|uniref:Ribonuclease n=1 Tax=Fistulifera solaris TaxID=1519565 RepID=A0A1Z5KP28_FISSO|nr:hypothetical protein FisN_13Hh040 [Fistulifera solaris]|eukprot:GAX27852.1 hypothetical protein FisN_13Hh040 [Fistulifera solaris]